MKLFSKLYSIVCVALFFTMNAIVSMTSVVSLVFQISRETSIFATIWRSITSAVTPFRQIGIFKNIKLARMRVHLFTFGQNPLIE